MQYYVLACAIFVLVRAQTQTYTVNTSQGTIIGSSATDGAYAVFYGVHYGGNTGGANRFKAPTPPPTYPGDFHAIDSSIVCAQPSIRGLIGQEDCLTMNIYTKNLTTLKPVMVYIQGEDYARTEVRPFSYRRLVEEDILVITLNYRLSVFGFLCLGVEDAPGNAGLKDVIQGLQWISTNIAGFGGNPDNVMLFGHGSAAAMADLVTMSPLSTGLVHKVVAQSGSALAPWAVAYQPVAYARAFGARLGYTGGSLEELARHLVNTDATLLVNAVNEIELHNATTLFAPCIENVELNPNGTFLDDAPINILRSGNYSHIPYITGYTSREGTLRAEQVIVNNWLNLMQSNFTNFLPADLDFGANLTAANDAIRAFYFAQRPISMETIEDYLDYHGDILVVLSVIRGARQRALTSTADVRLWEFDYRGTQNSDWPYQQIPLTGVKHGGILNFLFDHDLTTTDEGARQSVLNSIVSFARTGVATSGVTWVPVTSSLFNYIALSGGLVNTNFTVFKESLLANPHSQRTTFWNNYYENYYVTPTSVVSSAGQLMCFTVLLSALQFVVRVF